MQTSPGECLQFPFRKTIFSYKILRYLSRGHYSITVLRLRPRLLGRDGIDDFAALRGKIIAGIADLEGNLTHAFHSACQNHCGIAAPDGPESIYHRLKAGGALPLHGVSRNALRQTRQKHGVPPTVGRPARLFGDAHDHFIDHDRIYRHPPHRLPHHRRTQLLLRETLQLSTKGPQRRPDSAHQHDPIHCIVPPSSHISTFL